jgi:hypothetical protein
MIIAHGQILDHPIWMNEIKGYLIIFIFIYICFTSGNLQLVVL